MLMVPPLIVGAVQRQRVAAVDLDDAAGIEVGKDRPVHRDVIQCQRHFALNRHPAIVQDGVRPCVVCR